MKKFFYIVFIIVFALLPILCSCDNKKTKDSSDTFIKNGIVIKKITDDYYIEKMNSVKHNLFYSKDLHFTEMQSNDISDKKLIETEKYIIKYSVDGNFIAYHYNELCFEETDSSLYKRTISATEYNVTKDVFVVFDTETKKSIEFFAQDEFVDYCRTRSLELFNWIFVSGVKFENIKLTNSCQLFMSESVSVPDQFIVDDIVVIEGYISDYQVLDSSVSFRLRVPNKSSLEFPKTSNSNLGIKDIVVGKRFCGLVLVFPLYEELYFDDVVSINTVDGTMCSAEG